MSTFRRCGGTTAVGRRLWWMYLGHPFYQRRKYDLSSQRPSWGLVGSAGKGVEGASGRLVPNRGWERSKSLSPRLSHAATPPEMPVLGVPVGLGTEE